MAQQPSLSQPQYRIVVERNLPAKMRDGVTLRADVHRPDAPGAFPVILMRVPYDKTAATPLHYVDYFVPRGYVVVVQDTRGRYASEGEYYPLIHEATDGYDSVEWAATLPWADGRVGTAGQSYHGATQYLLSHTRPPHLVCQVPISASADFHASWVYHTGGAFEFGWQVPYAIFMARNTAERKGLGGAYLRRLDEYVLPEINFAQPLKDEWYRHLPIKDWADWLKDTAPYFVEYLNHPNDGPYWEPLNLYNYHQHIGTPMYHIGSWYDIFQEGTLGNFTGIVRHGRPEARTTQKLLMGPWGHLRPYAAPTTGGTGDIDFGPHAAIEIHDIELRWFDHWLKGIDTGFMREPPVKIFVMGDNVWREEQEWPLARTQYTTYYLHSQGSANSLHGNGTLSPETPAQEPPDSYVYDPHDPVPTRGGNTLVIPMGVYDQRPVEERRDVLCYTSETLSRPLEITGPISVKLYAASSAPDTDFTAKLVVVRPDGYAQNLADGIIRARYRNSRTDPSPITPGAIYEYNIDLWSTSYVFPPGSRIRVEIASANFPRFDRNPNTGQALFADAELQAATQTIFHDATHPSRIVLPVIPHA
ncbi:MAG TPA: CocE/NonD family hydrolase [Alphaproteobacteria bacterium]|nr:CocE/NonD family hydrolase [Alphaproteobacteria bacterium]